jgi:hypothetical protein
MPPDLERDLRALATEPWAPPTPDLAGAVVARLRAAPVPAAPRRPWRARPRRTLVVALAALVVLPAAALAIPPVRDQVLDWLGISAVEIRRVPQLPPGVAARAPELGRRVSLEEARRAVTFPVRVPAALGTPDQIGVERDVPGGRVNLAYLPGAGIPRDERTGLGLFISQLEGGGSTAYIEKLIGPGTTLRRLTLGGAPAVWITGTPHGVSYEDRTGTIHTDTPRLSGNVLLFERGRVVLRLEGKLALGRMLEVARSMR